MAYTAWSVSQDEVPNVAKWNQLNSNDAHFYSFLGDNMEWQDWTPTWTNLTVGAGTVIAKYIRVGKIIFCRIRFVFGTGSAISGGVSFTLPVTPSTGQTASEHILGSCYFEDKLITGYLGTFSTLTATTVRVLVYAVSAATVDGASLSSTVPHTWASGDYFDGNFFYEGV